MTQIRRTRCVGTRPCPDPARAPRRGRCTQTGGCGGNCRQAGRGGTVTARCRCPPTGWLAVVAVDPAYTSRLGVEHWLGASQKTSPAPRGHHPAAPLIGRRGLGQRARRRERCDRTQRIGNGELPTPPCGPRQLGGQPFCPGSGPGNSDLPGPAGSRTSSRGVNRPTGTLGATRWRTTVRGHPQNRTQFR
jgi:hypothetical protein